MVFAYIASPILKILPIGSVNVIILAFAAPVTVDAEPKPLADLKFQFTVSALLLIKVNHSPSFFSKYSISFFF